MRWMRRRKAVKRCSSDKHCQSTAYCHLISDVSVAAAMCHLATCVDSNLSLASQSRDSPSLGKIVGSRVGLLLFHRVVNIIEKNERQRRKRESGRRLWRLHANQRTGHKKRNCFIHRSFNKLAAGENNSTTDFFSFSFFKQIIKSQETTRRTLSHGLLRSPRKDSITDMISSLGWLEFLGLFSNLDLRERALFLIFLCWLPCRLGMSSSLLHCSLHSVSPPRSFIVFAVDITGEKSASDKTTCFSLWSFWLSLFEYRRAAMRASSSSRRNWTNSIGSMPVNSKAVRRRCPVLSGHISNAIRRSVRSLALVSVVIVRERGVRTTVTAVRRCVTRRLVTDRSTLSCFSPRCQPVSRFEENHRTDVISLSNRIRRERATIDQGSFFPLSLHMPCSSSEDHHTWTDSHPPQQKRDAENVRSCFSSSAKGPSISIRLESNQSNVFDHCPINQLENRRPVDELVQQSDSPPERCLCDLFQTTSP